MTPACGKLEINLQIIKNDDSEIWVENERVRVG
jgi:hypothetical protein